MENSDISLDYFGECDTFQPRTYAKVEKHALDWKCPGKKYNGKTMREVMQTRKGRDYLKFYRSLELPVKHDDESQEDFFSRMDYRLKHNENIDKCFERFENFKKRKLSQSISSTTQA